MGPATRQDIVLGLAIAVLAAAIAVVGVNVGAGTYNRGDEVVVTFDDATQGIRVGADVKVRGVTVGRVQDIDLLDDGRAQLRLFIDEGNRVPETAVASLEPLSIFGPRFVRLDPGASELDGPFLTSGDAITGTVEAVDVGDVVSEASRLLDAIDVDDVITILGETADGLDGLGPDVAVAVDSVDVLAGVVAGRLPETRQFLVDIAALSTELADHADELVVAAENFNQVLPDVNARGDEVGRLLDGVTRVAGDAADILADNAPAIDATLIGLDDVAGVLAERPELLLDVLGLLEAFLGRLGEVIRIPHPNGSTLGAFRTLGPDGICGLIVGALGCGAAP